MLNPFYIHKVDIISSYSGQVFRIAPTVTDLEIFEHLERPYLTGLLSFVDTSGFQERINLSGTDVVEIEISYIDENSETSAKNVINRKFAIDKIVALDKTSQGKNFIVVHMIELHGYLDRLVNACSVRSGTRVEMIENILNDFLPPSKGTKTETGLELIFTEEKEYDDVLRTYIIPQNTTPLQACEVLRKSDATVDKFPYFLYSALNNDGLRYQSLKTILEAPVTQSFIWDNIGADQRAPSSLIGIHSWKSNLNLNYLDLVSEGLAGAVYNYHDPNIGIDNMFGYNISTSLTEYKVVDQVDEIASKVVTNCLPNNTFGDTASIHDVLEGRNYKELIFSRSLKKLMSKSSIDIVLQDAKLFLSQSEFGKRQGEYEDAILRASAKENPFTNSRTLGKKIYIRFNSSEDGVIAEDAKMSGNHIIYATRFIFKRNQGNTCSGTITLTCTKLFNNSEMVETST